MKHLLALAAAGSAGTLCRYWLQGAVQRVAGTGFPMGTMTVNVLGCFAFGLVTALAEHRAAVSAETRAVITIGFLGAFTTFSTYVHEAAHLHRTSEWLHAAAYMFGSLALGLAGFLGGQAAARLG